MKRQKSKNKPELTHSELRKLHLARAKRLNRIVSASTTILIVLLAFTTWAIYTHDHKIVQTGINSLRQTLGQQNAIPKTQVINSTAGFSLSYSTAAIDANGLVYPEYKSNPSLYAYGTGPVQIITGNNLSDSRAYAAVNLWTISYEKKYGLSSNENPNFQMELMTSLAGDVFGIGRQEYGANISNIDISIKLFAPKTITTSYSTIIPSLASQSSTIINGVSYQKITYNMIDTTFKSESYTELQYVTIQNGRPFVIKLDITPNTTTGDVALLNQVINSVRYLKPDLNIFSDSVVEASANIISPASSTITTASSISPLPKGSINLPDQLSENSLKIVADNQPGVVRIGTISCFNFNLLLPSGKTAFNVQGACSGGSGSGSIVSNNGYISTNGHVVISSPSQAYQLYIQIVVDNNNTQAIENYLQYLIDSNVATSSQINKLISAIHSGDSTALQTLLNLSTNIPLTDYQVTNQSSSYAVQLSNIPIKFKTVGTTLSFEYNKYVIPAKLIGENFNINSMASDKVNLGTYSSSDVALLKVSGNGYPVINLGSLSDVQVNATLTAIGWPGFVDGGLNTTDTHTIPTATSGTILDIAKQSSGSYSVIISSVPIAEGNSGGPAFDNQGQEIGLTTYTVSSANPNSGVTQESSGGIIRSIDDFKSLVTSKGVILSTASQVDTLWDRVVNDFAIGHFKDAYKVSQQVQNLYPDNYLATSFESAAISQIAEGHDTSGPTTVTLASEILIPLVLLVSLIAAFEIIRHRHHGKRMGYNIPPLNPATNPYINSPYIPAQQPVEHPLAEKLPTPIAKPIINQTNINTNPSIASSANQNPDKPS